MIQFSKEQIYIVTGASSGIGEAVAILLNKLGSTVIAIARNEERLKAMKEKCKYPENIHIEIKDLTEDIDGLPKYVKSLKEKYGKFSGMAYCAGISCLKPLLLLDYDELKRVFDINYFTPIMMTKGITDRRNNIGKGCSLVYLSSINALASAKGQPCYSGSKAALSASIKAIAKEVSSYGIRLNSILPSMIKTQMTCSLQGLITPENGDERYPFGWGNPDDVANLVMFLLSDKSKFISGQSYVVDSGGVR